MRKLSGNALKTNTRNSNIEIVRILAAMMIIAAHLYSGDAGKNFSGIQQWIYVFVQSFFHAGLGVTLFMVISGYYLVRCSEKKVTKLVSITWCCSIFALLLRAVCGRVFDLISFDFSLKDIFKSLTPVTSVYFWYISCYIFLMILSPFINKAIEKISRQDFTKLIIALLVLFYAVPTFLYTDIMGDRGKGLITMICAYFIGAYLSKYKREIDIKKGVFAIIIISLISFAGNMAATLVRGETSYPFSRECSLTTICVAALIVVLATNKQSNIRLVNKISSRTIYVYMLGGTITGIITASGLFSAFDNKLWLVFAVLGLSVCVYIVSVLLSYIVEFPAKLVDFIIGRVLDIVKKIWSLFTARIKNEDTDC